MRSETSIGSTLTRCATLAVSACIIGLGPAPAQAATQTLTFTATADAYLDEATPTAAMGSAAPTDCLVNDDTGTRRECRLRFVVSGVQAGDTITAAKVLIRNKGDAGSKLVNMSTVAASPAWAESTITWANKPPKVAMQGSDSTHSFGLDSEFAADAGVLTANATYDFALHSPPASYTSGLNFHTKENTVGQRAPRLVVTLDRPAPAFGINVPAGSADRLAKLGRIPWARGPYYGKDALPTTFALAEAQAIAPEQRLQMSFKRLPAQILDGSYDARITSYLKSIPAGWTVGVTYWHEPNCELAHGSACSSTWFSAADFKAAWYRIGQLIADSAAAATVIPMPNYTGPGGASFDDSWMVARSLMPASSILTWDKYGNPPPPIDALANLSLPYRGLYPTPANTYGATVAATVRLGWGNSWAITELNAPRRTADQSEVDRRQWFVDAIAYLTSGSSAVGGLSKPMHLFVWEGIGVQFDQRLYTQATWDTLRPYFTSSP
jgi:hypothetical protein